MTTISAIIIEDEQHNVRELTRALSRVESKVDILDQATTGEQAVSMISLHQPDLIFLDVELPDMDGFDLLDQLTNRLEVLPAVIFVTGHDDFGVRAFRYGAVDYLLKPIIPDELGEAIDRVMARSARTWEDRVKSIEKSVTRFMSSTQKFGVASRKGIHFYDLKEIVRIKADQNRSDLFFADGTEVRYINHSIKQLHSKLAGFGFLRVSQSDMVNICYLKSVEQHMISLCHHPNPIPISKRYRKEVMNQLRGLV